MGQVPKYGIVGGGAVAQHFCHYFQLENIPFQSWNRNSETPLHLSLNASDTVLLLIPDRA